MHTHSFNKVCEPNRLRQEIQDSAITIALDNIVVNSTTTYVDFKTELSEAEHDILDALILAHVPTPLENAPTKVDIDTTPAFAKATHRTKWNGSEVVTVEPDSVATIDYKLTEDRASFGGIVVYYGAKVGDWIESMIVDDEANPTIPEAYRSTVENWPIINQYIYRYNLPEGNSSRELNTYPLVAELKAGWSIRVKYHASSELGTRQVSTNLFLLQKLP